MDGMDSRSARTRTRGAGWLCALVVTACTLLVPGVAHAGIGVSAVPSFPTTATVGDTGLTATIQVSNRNDGVDENRPNYVCNFNSGSPCTGPGITLIPSCGALGDFSACLTPDPGVFKIANTGTGVPGSACAGMGFSITLIDAASGRLRFTPVAGQTIALAGAGAACEIAFTFDVIGSPDVDQSQDPGVQTAQTVDNTQRLDQENLTGSARGSSAGTTILRARPTIATQASPSVRVGGQLTDTAVVSGRVNPVAGATVDFILYGPDDANCAGPPIFQSLARPVDADGRAVSDPYVPTAPGTYRWRAFYSGDANNEPVAGVCNAANENVVVTPPGTSTSGGPPTVRPPRITVNDTPGSGGRCTESNFTLRVNARSAGLKSVRVTLDGKTIAKSKQAKFKVRVKAKAKKFGRHVIRIIANGRGGRTVRVLEFRRCGRPVQPRFVG